MARGKNFKVMESFGGKVLSSHSTATAAIKAATKASAKRAVDVWDTKGGPFQSVRIGHFTGGRGSYLRNPNPGPSALPSKWTKATVMRKGGQIQIRIGGRR
jgi:hypothetical protein